MTAEQLYASANFSLSLIPSRLAHRLHALRNLPFIVVSNPHIARIYNNYVHSLSTLLPYQEKTITNLEDEKQFTEVMADLVQTHSNTIPILARGFLECRKYISGLEVTRFLDEHLRARIGTRLIAEQHIALHLSSRPHCQPSHSNLSVSDGSSSPIVPPSTHIGVIDTALRPADIITHCESTVGEICELKYGVRPRVNIIGDTSTTLAQVPTHLEYVITEILKNAFRATIETGAEREPIEITIAASSAHGFPRLPTRTHGVSHDGANNPITSTMIPRSLAVAPSPASPTLQYPSRNRSVPALTIRVRDRGGGIPPTILPHIWAYSFTTFCEQDKLPSSPTSSTSTAPSTDAAVGGMPGGEQDTALNTLTATAVPGSANSLAGLGYGLPLGRAYAEHFGGRLSVQSLWGWGTDVYLRVEGLMGENDV